MTDAGGATPTPPPPDDDPRATMKAGLLIGAAVLIGFVLLLKGFSQEGGVVDTSASKSGKTDQTTTTTSKPSEETTTTTAAAGKAPADVSVMVANGSGKSGVAGTTATKLKSAGYTKVDTTNANVVSKSAVYYAPDAQADAAAVAKALGIDASAVSALPTPPPADPKGATVLVVVGPEAT